MTRRWLAPVACAAGLMAAGASQAAMTCTEAAASVAANRPAGATTLRITKAEDQAATSTATGTVKAHCLIEGALNERVSASGR